MSKTIKGTVMTVITSEGCKNPNSFEIKGDDGKDYFAHLGDIKENESKLYHDSDTTFLKKGDIVEFKAVDYSGLRAINIIKLSAK